MVQKYNTVLKTAVYIDGYLLTWEVSILLNGKSKL